MAGLLPKLGGAAGAIGGMAGVHALGLGDLLAPLDYPRQALWNLPGKLADGDWIGALPGLVGAGAGAGLLASGVGAPLAILGGSLLGGLGQGVGRAASPDRFEAPTANSLTEALGMDPDSGMGMATSMGLGIAGDPLTWMGGFGGGKLGRAAGSAMESEGAGNMLGRLARDTEGSADIDKLMPWFGEGRTGRDAYESGISDLSKLPSEGQVVYPPPHNLNQAAPSAMMPDVPQGIYGRQASPQSMLARHYGGGVSSMDPALQDAALRYLPDVPGPFTGPEGQVRGLYGMLSDFEKDHAAGELAGMSPPQIIRGRADIWSEILREEHKLNDVNMAAGRESRMLSEPELRLIDNRKEQAWGEHSNLKYMDIDPLEKERLQKYLNWILNRGYPSQTGSAVLEDLHGLSHYYPHNVPWETRKDMTNLGFAIYGEPHLALNQGRNTGTGRNPIEMLEQLGYPMDRQALNDAMPAMMENILRGNTGLFEQKSLNSMLQALGL